MQRDARAYLWDIREAADAIKTFIDGVDFKTYANTPLIHSAVERKFEIIGEALNLLSKVDPAMAHYTNFSSRPTRRCVGTSG